MPYGVKSYGDGEYGHRSFGGLLLIVISDPLGLTDSAQTINAFLVVISDPLGETDSLTRAFLRTLIESEGLSDELASTLAQLGCAILEMSAPPCCIVIEPDDVDIDILVPTVSISIEVCD